MRILSLVITLLSLVLLGTLLVLSTVSAFFGVWRSDFITPAEISHSPSPELVPRIVHQTWKVADLPARWLSVRDECRALNPEFEFMLWTDASSRQFIAEHYPFFLPTFDGYEYAIQRADAIRYFVLAHHGGIYFDLDVGCRASLLPLLKFPVVLPQTKPVGVSNDVMVSAKGHPFMEQAIHSLISFDHNFVLPYATVMFSTGPMFISRLANSWRRAAQRDIRILPPELYGKNRPKDTVPNAFFEHYYASSWHDDDAAFVNFLGTSGKNILKGGLAILAAFILYSLLRRKPADKGYVPLATDSELHSRSTSTSSTLAVPTMLEANKPSIPRRSSFQSLLGHKHNSSCDSDFSEKEEETEDESWSVWRWLRPPSDSLSPTTTKKSPRKKRRKTLLPRAQPPEVRRSVSPMPPPVAPPMRISKSYPARTESPPPAYPEEKEEVWKASGTSLRRVEPETIRRASMGFDT